MIDIRRNHKAQALHISEAVAAEVRRQRELQKRMARQFTHTWDAAAFAQARGYRVRYSLTGAKPHIYRAALP